jgi:hypothetical protein
MNETKSPETIAMEVGATCKSPEAVSPETIALKVGSTVLPIDYR